MDVEMWETITKMHRKYGGRVAHATHVAALVSRLFEKWAPLHGLSAQDCTPLICAAHLHDIGHFVSKKQHHKHSYYLIQHDTLLADWDESHREETALIALNHRKKKLLLLEDLKKSRRAKLTASIALLRIADALDCEHNQQTRILDVTIEEAKRRVTTTIQGFPLHKHRKSLLEKMSLAQDLWGFSLYVESGSEHLMLAPDRQRA